MSLQKLQNQSKYICMQQPPVSYSDIRT